MGRELTLRMIFAAANKASAPMRAVQESASTMGRELKAARDDLRSLERTQKDLDGFRRTEEQLKATARELDAARLKVGLLGREIEEADSPTKEMQRNFERAGLEAEKLATTHGKQSRELRDLQRELRLASINTEDLGGEQLELKRRVEQASNAVKEQEDRLSALAAQRKRMAAAREQMDATRATGDRMMAGGAQAIGAGAAIGAPVVLATNEAMGFQAQLIDIRKVIDGLDDAGLRRIENGLIDLGARMPVPIEGLGLIAAEGARAGVAQRDLIEFTELAAKMGRG